MAYILRSVLACAAISLALSAWSAGAARAAEFTPEQKAEIEAMIGEYIRKNPDVIGDYLRENPEILLEASDILKKKQEEMKEAAAIYALSAHRDKIERHPMTPATGNPDGDVTIVEFFDYQCQYCKRVFSYMTQLEKEDPNLRVVWKEFPILGPVSQFAAAAAMAADRQGKYMEFHIAVMGARGRLTEGRVLELAGRTGIDVERLQEDMKDPKIKAYLEETIQLANALGINGTPGFVVGDEIVAGAIDKAEMKKLVEFTRRKGS